VRKISRAKAPEAVTIMMVDDEPTTLDVIEMLLRAEGYQRFVRATEGSRTLELLAHERPDVLLLNLRMPGVSGLDILRSIGVDETLRNIPVILVTSSTDFETRRTALAHGAADFLAKPVDASELSLRIRRTLAASTVEESAPLVSRLDGTNDRCREIVQTFVHRLHEKLLAMQASLGAGDFEELYSLAHWLKGAAGTVGFDAFTEPAAALLRHARDGKRDEVETSIQELCALTDRIVILDGPE